MRYAVFLFLAIVIPCNAWFEYDRAVAAGQQKQWGIAKTSLTQQLVDQPENSELLYDAGVASYRANDFSQAASYFKHAAETANNTELKERACFNAGNAYAQQKELDKAIEQYEKTLELNPENERAKHNLEELKKQKEQEQQNQQDQNQDQDQDNKDQKDQEQNRDQDNKNSDQNKDKSDQKENDQSKNDDQQNKEDGEKKEDDSDQKQDSENKENEDSQQKQENDEQQNSDQDKQDEEQKKSEQEQNAKEGKEEEQNKNGDQGKSQQQEEKEEQEQPAAQGQEGDANEQHIPQVDAWVARMLEQCDEHDKQKTKLLIQRNINTQETGTDREHCW